MRFVQLISYYNRLLSIAVLIDDFGRRESSSFIVISVDAEGILRVGPLQTSLDSEIVFA